MSATLAVAAAAAASTPPPAPHPAAAAAAAQASGGLLALCCSVTAFVLFLGPLPMVREIRRRRSSGAYSVLPLAAAFVNCAIWALYGAIHGPTMLLLVNSTGAVLEAAYLTVFLRNTKQKQRAGVTLGIACMSALLVFVMYVLRAPGGFAGSPQKVDTDAPPAPPHAAASGGATVADRLGTFGVFVGVCMFASPFATVKHVLATRSADSLPLGIILVSMVNCTLWTVYGLRLSDIYIWGLNSLGFLLASAQFALHQRFSNPLCVRYFKGIEREHQVQQIKQAIDNPFDAGGRRAGGGGAEGFGGGGGGYAVGGGIKARPGALFADSKSPSDSRRDFASVLRV